MKPPGAVPTTAGRTAPAGTRAVRAARASGSGANRTARVERVRGRRIPGGTTTVTGGRAPAMEPVEVARRAIGAAPLTTDPGGATAAPRVARRTGAVGLAAETGVTAPRAREAGGEPLRSDGTSAVRGSVGTRAVTSAAAVGVGAAARMRTGAVPRVPEVRTSGPKVAIAARRVGVPIGVTQLVAIVRIAARRPVRSGPPVGVPIGATQPVRGVRPGGGPIAVARGAGKTTSAGSGGRSPGPASAGRALGVGNSAGSAVTPGAVTTGGARSGGITEGRPSTGVPAGLVTRRTSVAPPAEENPARGVIGVRTGVGRSVLRTAVRRIAGHRWTGRGRPRGVRIAVARPGGPGIGGLARRATAASSSGRRPNRTNRPGLGRRSCRRAWRTSSSMRTSAGICVRCAGT